MNSLKELLMKGQRPLGGSHSPFLRKKEGGWKEENHGELKGRFSRNAARSGANTSMLGSRPAVVVWDDDSNMGTIRESKVRGMLPCKKAVGFRIQWAQKFKAHG